MPTISSVPIELYSSSTITGMSEKVGTTISKELAKDVEGLQRLDQNDFHERADSIFGPIEPPAFKKVIQKLISLYA